MAGFGAHSGSSSGGPFTSGTAAGGSAATRIVPLNRDSGIVKSGSEQRPRQARSSCCRAHWQRAAFRGRQRPNTSLQATNAGERSGSEQRETQSPVRVLRCVETERSGGPQAFTGRALATHKLHGVALRWLSCRWAPSVAAKQRPRANLRRPTK